MLTELERLAEAYAGMFAWMTLFSVLTVIAMVTFGTRVVARLPADYFSNPEHRRSHEYLERFHPAVRLMIPVAKNVVGIILVLTGVVLLVLPGQGLLTMLAGTVLVDFPGKYACERWLVRRPQVHRSINWLRRRAGEGPLVL